MFLVLYNHPTLCPILPSCIIEDIFVNCLTKTMKNSILLALFVLTLVQSCKKDEFPIATCENCNFTCLDANESDVISNQCIDNWECAFKVTPQSSVDTTTSDGLASGNNLVFQMINSTEGSPNIADDEFTDILVFELNASQQSFSVEGEDLRAMNVYFKRVCFCVEVVFKEVTSGCMQGEKQADGSWYIQGNLRVSYSFGEEDVKFEAQFVN